MIKFYEIANINKFLVSILAGGFICSLSLAMADENDRAKVIGLTGQVQYKNPGDLDWQTATQGLELAEGASVFVGPDSDCQLAFGTGFQSVTHIKQDSRVVLRSISTDPQLEISNGEVFALVRNLKKESSFRISTPTAVATVRGTAFSFAAEGIGQEADSTLQVFDHTVGLNPIDKLEEEMPIEEGHGAVMGADGKIEKEFELSPEDMQAGRDFMNEALVVMDLPKPETENVPAPARDTDEGDEDKKDGGPGGPNPPAPPTGGPPDGSGVDSAVDGVVMDMAQDSEMSQTDTFGSDAMNHMVSNLADLNYGEKMPGDETVKNAVSQTDYFQNLPPDVQDRMLSTVDNYYENGPMPGPLPEGGMQFDGSAPYTGDREAFPTGTDPFFGMGQDPMLDPMMRDGFFNPNDLASIINNSSNLSPHELQSIINFALRIQQDYNAYLAANSGNDTGYFSGPPRVIQNFSFIKDDQPYTGCIVYDPVNKHTHSEGTFLHLQNVVVKDDPTGVSGQVIVEPTLNAPGGIIEVKTI